MLPIFARENYIQQILAVFSASSFGLARQALQFLGA
jgi:hypothetical protein